MKYTKKQIQESIKHWKKVLEESFGRRRSVSTVGELKEALEFVDDNVKIKAALQPRYPMKGSLKNVCREVDADGNTVCVWLAMSDNEDYGVDSDVWSDDEISPDSDEEE